MNFQVPQFIDIEDKIFGPLSFKQFLYVLGGGGGAFILFKVLPTFLAVILGIPFLAFAFLLAFYKVNERPFIAIVESWFNYLLKNKLYLWKVRKVEKKDPEKKEEDTVNYVPKLSSSKLKEMSWSLDVLDVKNKDNDSSLNI